MRLTRRRPGAATRGRSVEYAAALRIPGVFPLILKYMAEKKIPRLFDDALEKFIAGGTSYSEIIGVPR